MKTRFAILVSILLLAACTMIGPTVPVTPAAGKPPDVFAEDRRACMKMTDATVQAMANQLNATGLARGPVPPAVSGTPNPSLTPDARAQKLPPGGRQMLG